MNDEKRNDASGGSPLDGTVGPDAWMGGDGHPRHLSHLHGARERQLYGPLTPLYGNAALRRALRSVECSHTGMSYGDDKAGGPSAYTKGWGDCLQAVQAALGLVGPKRRSNRPWPQQEPR